MAPPRKSAKQEVKFYVDMKKINDLIGAFLATEKMGANSNYLASNLSAATYRADDEFNRHIAAKAMATGKFAHMFEWGTVGINTAPTNKRSRPDQESSRLWRTHIEVSRGIGTMTYQFKNSVAIVPKPTVKKTKIPRSITSKLSDHVFWNKAKVMESGQTVRVARIKAKNLFIPLAYTGQPGFTMSPGPTGPTPGQSEFYRSHAGTFDAEFRKFYSQAGLGGVLVQEQVEEFYRTDLERVVDKIRAQPPGRWSPPNKVNSLGQIERSKKTTIKLLEAAAQEREVQSGI
jgi:hypothetical protein